MSPPPLSFGRPSLLPSEKGASGPGEQAQTLRVYQESFWVGQHFLFVQHNEPPREPTPLVVVLNWFEELKRRVPAE